MNIKTIKKSLVSIALGAFALTTFSASAFAEEYRIKQDDTFWTISQAYGLPLSSVLAANKGVDPLNLQEGQTIQLPTKNSVAKAPTFTAKESSKPVKIASAADDNTIITPSGKSYEFRKSFDVVASAYSADPSENGGYGAVDYFGDALKLGTIAVDPKVIPFGTKLFITGYDFAGLPQGGMIATASDAGGAIKGKRIDIFIPGSKNKVNMFGFQDVKVYILK